MLGQICQARLLFALIAIRIACGILIGRRVGHVIDQRIANSSHGLFVGHIVGKIGHLEELLAATRAKQVIHAPAQALEAVGTARKVEPVLAHDALDRQVILLISICILERRELLWIGSIRGMPGILGKLAQLGKLVSLFVVNHVIGVALKFAAAIDDRLEHAVLLRIVAVALLHEVDERIATIKLVETHGMIAVAIAKAQIVIAAALVLGEVLQLGGKRHRLQTRGACRHDRIEGERHKRRGVHGFRILIARIVIRRSGLLCIDIGDGIGVGIADNILLLDGIGLCKHGNRCRHAQRERKCESGNDSLMLRLHGSSLVLRPLLRGWIHLMCDCVRAQEVYLVC